MATKPPTPKQLAQRARYKRHVWAQVQQERQDATTKITAPKDDVPEERAATRRWQHGYKGLSVHEDQI